VFSPDRASPSQRRSPTAATSLSGALHPKLVVGRVNDPLEDEADRVTERVMRMADPQRPFVVRPPRISRENAPSGKEKRHQGSESRTPEKSSAAEIPESLHEVLLSPGQSLDASSLAYFETRFGHDFSHVRVHTGAAADQSARELNAYAFTVGHDIVFGQGKLAPERHEGRRLLAHELTHVVQSTGDPTVVRRYVGGDIRTQTITPKWVKALTDSELQQQTDIVTQELAKLAPDSAGRQPLSAALALLEEEASLRGVSLPAATAFSLFNLIAPLANDISQLQASLRTAGWHVFPR
jgi:Domain of unknown function (DUF4157)